MQALQNFKTYFFRGLAALLPTILTVWVFVQFYFFIQQNVSSHINRGMVRILVYSTPHYPHVTQDDLSGYVKKNFPFVSDEPQMFEEKINDLAVKRAARIEKAEEFWVQGKGQIAGFLIAFILIVFVGAFLASFAGKTIWRIFERAFMKAPVVKKIYPHIKQVTDFFLSKQKLAFNGVVAVEYPRKGTWSVAMVTGTGLKRISDTQNKEFLTLFVPTSPTPFTGYVIMVPKDEVIEMGMSVEEALRFTISGGVISPSIFQSYAEKSNTTQLKSE
ncbi:MAG: DUF502 domain-containing protein [Phycisphaerae bacterium]|nr:DUF502 domain-containing protein [Phycisphaerae bacterium]